MLISIPNEIITNGNIKFYNYMTLAVIPFELWNKFVDEIKRAAQVD